MNDMGYVSSPLVSPPQAMHTEVGPLGHSEFSSQLLRWRQWGLGNNAMDADQRHNHRTRFPRAFCTVSKSPSFNISPLMSSVLSVCTLPCSVACRGSPVGAKHGQWSGDEQRRISASQAFPLFPFCYIIKHITAIKYYLCSINILINF